MRAKRSKQHKKEKGKALQSGEPAAVKRAAKCTSSAPSPARELSGRGFPSIKYTISRKAMDLPDQSRLPRGLLKSPDPIDGNPFQARDPRHDVWRDATLRAEGEIYNLEAEYLQSGLSEPNSPRNIEKLVKTFNIWAERYIQVVWSDPEIKAFDDWLFKYAEGWLKLLDNRRRSVLFMSEARAQLTGCVNYWKGEARRYLAAQRAHKAQSASSSGAAVEQSKSTVNPSIGEGGTEGPANGARHTNAEEAPHLTGNQVAREAFSGFHSEDDYYRGVWLDGKQFGLTSRQADIIKFLHNRQQRGAPEVLKAELMEAVESKSSRLRDAFRSRPEALRALIVSVLGRKGYVKLNLGAGHP